jgi:hypothetical protein
MAVAAFNTGGTDSARGGGRGLVVSSPPTALASGAAGAASVPDTVRPRGALTALSDDGNSWRRTGSEPDWYRDAMAGVFMKAPGTGRMGVICGKAISIVGRRVCDIRWRDSPRRSSGCSKLYGPCEALQIEKPSSRSYVWLPQSYVQGLRRQ